MAYYGLEWTEINRRGEIISRRKEFACLTARARFINSLPDKQNFCEIVALPEGV